MPEVSRLALQNDLFLAKGLNLVLCLPIFRKFWDPVVHPRSVSEQSQIASGTHIVPDRTVLLLPKATALNPTPTSTVTHTMYETVKGQITSISTVIDRYWVTKWTHFPTDSTTSYATSTYTTTTTPGRRYAPGSPTVPIIPWAWSNFITISLPLIVLGAIWLMLKSELRSVAVPPAEGKTGETTLDIKEDKKHHQVEKAESRDIFRELETSRHEMQRLLEGIEKRNMLLKSLGIFEDNDGTPDEESLFRIAKEKKESLEANENRLRQLEGENAERQEKISNLEIENAKMKDDIATRLNEHYVEGVQPSFQSLLDDKQGEIRYWREAFHNNDKVKTIKDLNRLNEEKDAELSELRPLPEKISELEQALREASEQIEIVQQEKEDQNLADRRRWDSEKEELEADLEEAEKSAEQLKEILELQPDPATNKQHVERLTAEIDAIRNEATELQRQADNMAEMITDVVEDSEKFRQERDELEEALQKLQNEKEADEKN